jgi:hypothetical protein
MCDDGLAADGSGDESGEYDVLTVGTHARCPDRVSRRCAPAVHDVWRPGEVERPEGGDDHETGESGKQVAGSVGDSEIAVAVVRTTSPSAMSKKSRSRSAMWS